MLNRDVLRIIISYLDLSTLFSFRIALITRRNDDNQLLTFVDMTLESFGTVCLARLTTILNEADLYANCLARFITLNNNYDQDIKLLSRLKKLDSFYDLYDDRTKLDFHMQAYSVKGLTLRPEYIAYIKQNWSVDSFICFVGYNSSNYHYLREYIPTVELEILREWKHTWHPSYEYIIQLIKEEIERRNDLNC